MADRLAGNFDELTTLVLRNGLVAGFAKKFNEQPDLRNTPEFKGKTPEQITDETLNTITALKVPLEDEFNREVFANGKYRIGVPDKITSPEELKVFDKNNNRVAPDEEKKVLAKIKEMQTKMEALSRDPEAMKAATLQANPSLSPAQPAAAASLTPPVIPPTTTAPATQAAPTTSTTPAPAATTPAAADENPVLSRSEGPLASLASWARSEGLDPRLIGQYQSHVLGLENGKTIPLLSTFADQKSKQATSDDKDRWANIRDKFRGAIKDGSLPDDVEKLGGSMPIQGEDGRKRLKIPNPKDDAGDKEPGFFEKDGASMAAGLLGLVLGMALGGDMLVGLLIALLAFAAVSFFNGGAVSGMMGGKETPTVKSEEPEKQRGKQRQQETPAAGQEEQQSQAAPAAGEKKPEEKKPEEKKPEAKAAAPAKPAEEPARIPVEQGNPAEPELKDRRVAKLPKTKVTNAYDEEVTVTPALRSVKGDKNPNELKADAVVTLDERGRNMADLGKGVPTVRPLEGGERTYKMEKGKAIENVKGEFKKIQEETRDAINHDSAVALRREALASAPPAPEGNHVSELGSANIGAYGSGKITMKDKNGTKLSQATFEATKSGDTLVYGEIVQGGRFKPEKMAVLLNDGKGGTYSRTYRLENQEPIAMENGVTLDLNEPAVKERFAASRTRARDQEFERAGNETAKKEEAYLASLQDRPVIRQVKPAYKMPGADGLTQVPIEITSVGVDGEAHTHGMNAHMKYPKAGQRGATTVTLTDGYDTKNPEKTFLNEPMTVTLPGNSTDITSLSGSKEFRDQYGQAVGDITQPEPRPYVDSPTPGNKPGAPANLQSLIKPYTGSDPAGAFASVNQQLKNIDAGGSTVPMDPNKISKGGPNLQS